MKLILIQLLFVFLFFLAMNALLFRFSHIRRCEVDIEEFYHRMERQVQLHHQENIIIEAFRIASIVENIVFGATTGICAALLILLDRFLRRQELQVVGKELEP